MMSDKLPRIQVSETRRFLVTETGKPFFWLGDTAWELFHRASREEASLYFANRQEKGFNVIQAVVLAEVDGLNTPNVYGERPFHGNDPTRPNEAYFKVVDDYVRMAGELGLYIGMLPTWGDKVTPMWGIGPAIFGAVNAREYGFFLGNRYRDYTNILWILGGDRPAVTDQADFRPIWRALAAGIREASSGKPLMTYHPMGEHSCSAWLHDEEWLDVNMMQSGHGGGRDVPVWEMIGKDYDRIPTKPTLDGEPNYEDHPVNPWPTWNPENGYFRDYDVRKQVYRSIFAGGCGVTYGHQSIWQLYEEGRQPITYPDRTWREALNRPGASQVRYLRALMESRPYFTRIPDQSILVSDPGEGGTHLRATRDSEGHYAFVYFPTSRTVTVRLDFFAGRRVKAWWYDPRCGEAASLGVFSGEKEFTLTPPDAGPDWVLVLDNDARGYPPPGETGI